MTATFTPLNDVLRNAAIRVAVSWQTAPRWRRFLIVFLVVVGTVLVFAPGTAHAQSDSSSSSAASQAMNRGYKALPAWRWSDTASLHAKLQSTKDIVALMSVSAANFAFGLATVMWKILLFGVRIANDTDIVVRSYQSMDDLFAWTGSVLYGSELMLMIAGVAFAKSLYDGARKGAMVALRGVIAVSLPLAALGVMTNRAEQNQNERGAHGTYERQPFTPSWIAMESTEATGKISDVLADLMTKTEFAQERQDGGTTACDVYSKTLEKMYKDGFTVGPDGQAYNAAAQNIAVGFSRIWESSYLTLWAQGQYGPTVSGRRAVCHRAENESNVPRAAQIEVHNASYSGSGGHFAAKAERDAFGPYTAGSDQDRRANWAWAACEFNRNNGNPEVSPEWNNLKPKSKRQVDDDSCRSFVSEGFSRGTAAQKSFDFRESDFNDDGVAVKDDAQLMMQTFYGQRPSSSITAGMFALIVACIYLFAFGPMALGAVLAQFMFIMLLALVPLVLLTMAWPGQKTDQFGRRILRLIGATAFSKVLFTSAMALLLLMTSIIQQLLTTVFPS